MTEARLAEQKIIDGSSFHVTNTSPTKVHEKKIFSENIDESFKLKDPAEVGKSPRAKSTRKGEDGIELPRRLDSLSQKSKSSAQSKHSSKNPLKAKKGIKAKSIRNLVQRDNLNKDIVHAADYLKIDMKARTTSLNQPPIS